MVDLSVSPWSFYQSFPFLNALLLDKLALTHSPETRGKHSLFLVPCPVAVQGMLESHPSLSAAMSCLFSSVGSRNLATHSSPHLRSCCAFCPEHLWPPFLPAKNSQWTFYLARSAQHLPPITVICASFCVLHHHLHGAQDQHRPSGQHLLTGLKVLPSRTSFLWIISSQIKSFLIHIFKWRWDSHYLKLVLLKCNPVALNVFRMLGNHIDLVLERFHDSESNPECVKQYPVTSLLTAPGRHSSVFLSVPQGFAYSGQFCLSVESYHTWPVLSGFFRFS